MMIEVLQDIIYYKSKSHKLPREYYDALKEHCKSHYNSVGQLMKQFDGITEQEYCDGIASLESGEGDNCIFQKYDINLFNVKKLSSQVFKFFVRERAGLLNLLQMQWAHNMTNPYSLLLLPGFSETDWNLSNK